MVTRTEVIAEARTWRGTPHMHQQQTKGVGADCGGFIRGVAGALGIMPADPMQWEGYQEFAGYDRFPDGVLFAKACDRYLVRRRRDEMQLASVVLIKFEKAEHLSHCGLIADYRRGGYSLIHSAARLGKGGVVEHALDEIWLRRIVRVYDFPGVT